MIISVSNLENAASHYFKTKTKNFSKRSVVAYSRDITEFIRYFKTKRAVDITQKLIENYSAYLRSHYKAATARRKIVVINSFLSSLLTQGVLHIPTKIITTFKPTREVRRMPLEDIEQLMHYIKRMIKKRPENVNKYCRDRAFFELLLTTDLSIEELTKLNLGNIVIRDDTMLQYKGHKRQVGAYLVSRETIEALQEYLIRRKLLKTSTDALFTNRFGQRLSVYAINYNFDLYLKDAKIIGRYTPISMQHPAVSTPIIKIDPRVVDLLLKEKRLGHIRLWIFRY